MNQPLKPYEKRLTIGFTPYKHNTFMPSTFYHSPFCPRCAQAKKHLQKLLGKPLPDTVVCVDVLKHPVQTWHDGIRMIPALKNGEDLLSGFTLSPEEIESFLDRHNMRT